MENSEREKMREKVKYRNEVCGNRRRKKECDSSDNIKS